jgi:hypothetical protein
MRQPVGLSVFCINFADSLFMHTLISRAWTHFCFNVVILIQTIIRRHSTLSFTSIASMNGLYNGSPQTLLAASGNFYNNASRSKDKDWSEQTD